MNELLNRLKNSVNFQILNKVNSALLEQYKFVPISVKDNFLFVAINSQTDKNVVNTKLKEYYPQQVKFITVPDNDLIELINGIKADMEEDEVLILANRSSNPKKKNLVLINGIGIIDKDYYNNPDNEGEVAFAFVNISNETIVIESGEKLGQGMFVKYLITEDDRAEGVRNGGFGSTDK